MGGFEGHCSKCGRNVCFDCFTYKCLRCKKCKCIKYKTYLHLLPQ